MTCPPTGVSVKIKRVQDTAEEIILYALDKLKTKQNIAEKVPDEELGTKLLGPACMLNIRDQKHPEREFARMRALVRKGLNVAFAITISRGSCLVWSPEQWRYFMVRFAIHFGKLAYTTGQDGTIIQVDLLNQPAVLPVHDNTDNQHMHFIICLVSLIHQSVVSVNQDWIFLAAQWAARRAEEDMGLKCHPNMPDYELDLKYGAWRVLDPQYKNKKRPTERPKGGIPERSRKAREMREQETLAVETIRQLLHDRTPTAFSSLDELGAELAKANACAKKHRGGLVFVVDQEWVKASVVGKEWAWPNFQARFATAPGWQLAGTPEEEQKVIGLKDVMGEVVPAALPYLPPQRELEDLALHACKPVAKLPWRVFEVDLVTRTVTWDGCSGYHYSDSTIQGFSHTHLSGTGCGALGDLLLMPIVGQPNWEVGSPGKGYASKFSHTKEVATPGYYRVFLETPQVTAELTATARSGFHKYTFPASGQSHLILDLVHGMDKLVEGALNVEDQNTISGYRMSKGWAANRAVYFVVKISKPFDSVDIKQDEVCSTNAVSGKGKEIRAMLNFKTVRNEVILVKVGISCTGIEGARKNLETENPAWDFDTIRAAAVKQWQGAFDAVQLESFDPHIARTFYANLYLSYLLPSLFNDVDGTYRGYDHTNHTSTNFQNYTTFSIWDIYRAEWPLLTLLQPGRVDDMVQSMLTEYPQKGKHSTPVCSNLGGRCLWVHGSG